MKNLFFIIILSLMAGFAAMFGAIIGSLFTSTDMEVIIKVGISIFIVDLIIRVYKEKYCIL